jgi:hypothetical protein
MSLGNSLISDHIPLALDRLAGKCPVENSCCRHRFVISETSNNCEFQKVHHWRSRSQIYSIATLQGPSHHGTDTPSRSHLKETACGGIA